MLELATTKKLLVYSGDAHPALAADIATHLGVALGGANLRTFPNGELHCRFDESIRGADVFIIQTHCGNVNDSIMQQLLMIDAAKRASAKRITAVCPLYGYSRQDRKASGREPIAAKLVADMLTVAGADRIMSVDLHSGQIQGFFDGPVDHLTADPVLLDYLHEHAGHDLVVVAPDAGRVKVAERYSQRLGSDLAFVNKYRPKGGDASTVLARDVIGEVDGRLCVIIDDRIDTGGTLVAAAEILVEHGATDVWAMATHGVLAGEAIDRLKSSVISRVVITDTVPLPPEKQMDKIEILSSAQIIASAINAVFEDTSVSEIFDGQNLS